MNPLRQGFSWWCFANRGVDADALLSSAAAMGHEFVDLAGEKLWPGIFDHQIMEGNLVRTIPEHHGPFTHYHTMGNLRSRALAPGQTHQKWYPLLEGPALSGPRTEAVPPGENLATRV